MVESVSPQRSKQLAKRFLYSVKPVILVKEKGWSLGSEPAPEFLPSAGFKSGINLVHDTADYKADDSWHPLYRIRRLSQWNRFTLGLMSAKAMQIL